MFERALGFLWRSRSAACARAELSHTVGCVVRFGQTEHVRILMPLLVRAAEAGGGAGGGKSVVPYLFDAIREGHAEVVGALLEIGGPELPMSDSGESCLTVVVRHERVEILGVLARAMLDMDFYKLLLMPCLSNIDYSDMSCLHYSVYRGDPVMVKALLRAADRVWGRLCVMELTTDSGYTCLHMAAECCLLPRGFEVVQALLKAAGSAFQTKLLMRRSGPGDSCLAIAASVGSVDTVKALLEAAGPARRELLMLTNLVGDSCLHASVEEGRVATTCALLEAAGPARRELLMLRNAAGDSCLHVCVKEGCVDVARALLEAAGDWRRELLMLTDAWGNSCLHVCVKEGRVDVARALLEAAGPARRELLMLRNAAGDSCLHVCVKEGRVDVVRALLEAAGDWRRELLMLTDAWGNSCLHVCVMGAGMNPSRDFDPGGGRQLMPMPQNTCLYASVNEMRVNVVRALLEAAGDWRRELLMLQCHYGKSCLYLSVMMGNLTLTNALLEGAGDDAPELVMVSRTMGGTCLHISAMFSCEHLMMALLEAAGPRRRELLIQQSCSGMTVLHIASYSTRKDFVQVLLEAAGEHKSELLLIPDYGIDLSSFSEREISLCKVLC